MDVLLIDPPWHEEGVLSSLARCRYTVGLTSLAAYLRDGGVDVGILTANLLNDSEPSAKVNTAPADRSRAFFSDTHDIWRRIADFARQANPKVVGVAYLTTLGFSVEKTVRLVKETDPEIKVVVGSMHPTFLPEKVMENPDIDFVIVGEGEIPLLSLVRQLESSNPRLEDVPGIYYRDSEGQVSKTPRADLISNLDELPFLARDLVLECDFDTYRGHVLSTTRGCPYSCVFCADKGMWGPKVRRRSVENVIAEMKFLETNYKVGALAINDGTFTYDRGYVEAFCYAIISEGLTLKWYCTARYDSVDKELAKLMKSANCYHLEFGLESGSDTVLDAMNKHISVDQIVRVSEEVYDAGLSTSNTVLFGLPYESKEDMERTLNLMKRIKTFGFFVSSYTPLPGSPLWNSMSKEEQDSVDWRTTNFESNNNYYTEKVSRREFREIIMKAREIEKVQMQASDRLRMRRI